ncbi:MAG: UDP-N-acetylmuramoyl-L-alanine--D-glutamate ligase [Verrucomicrobiota bacterium]
MDCSGKNIVVLGLGRSGQAAARLACARGATVTVCDSGDPDRLAGAASNLKGEGIDVVIGEQAEKLEQCPQVVILSPGIDESWPISAQFAESGAEMIGEMEFAYRFWNGEIVGITGTNGKTTTTELVAAFLNAGGIETEPAGNHGKPFSELIIESTKSTTATLEISSFQLENIVDFTPNVAVWLNFAPDHLDRYTSLEAYRNAKLRLFENAGSETVIVHRTGEQVPTGDSRTITFNAFDDGADYSFDGTHIRGASGETLELAATRLRGRHNVENLMAAWAAADSRGVSVEAVRSAAAAYQPPRHRNEFTAEVAGREFFNDSKATNLHALESSLRGCSEKVVLIAGGKEKGLPFVNLKETVASKVSHAFLIGQIGPNVADVWGESVPCTVAPDLESAVSGAFEASTTGQSILFSPGTSSFDMFSGYEERGDAFRDAVEALKKSI